MKEPHVMEQQSAVEPDPLPTDPIPFNIVKHIVHNTDDKTVVSIATLMALDMSYFYWTHLVASVNMISTL